MRSIRSKSVARLAAGVLVLLMVHGLGSVRTAWAGCNHLVSSRSDRSLNFDQFDRLIYGTSSALSADLLGRDTEVPLRPKPCSGLSCSSGIPMPASNASLVHEGSDQWGTLASLTRVLTASPGIGHCQEPAARASGAAASIFRPPPA